VRRWAPGGAKVHAVSQLFDSLDILVGLCVLDGVQAPLPPVEQDKASTNDLKTSTETAAAARTANTIDRRTGAGPVQTVKSVFWMTAWRNHVTLLYLRTLSWRPVT